MLPLSIIISVLVVAVPLLGAVIGVLLWEEDAEVVETFEEGLGR